ncbi:unnamed protein product [Lampetra planeri]
MKTPRQAWNGATGCAEEASDGEAAERGGRRNAVVAGGEEPRGDDVEERWVPQCNGTACTAHAQLRPAGDLDLKNAEKVRVKGGERNSTAWLHHGTVCSAVRRPRGFARGVETRPQASREASPAASGAVVGRGGRSGGRA